jgi:hypothetical protein
MRDDAQADPAVLLMSALADQIADRLASRLAPQLAEIVGAGLPDQGVDSDRLAENAVAANNGAEQISDDGEMWTTRRVAAHYGVAVGFIYQHADELGCVRLGGTARPRLRFDPAVVRERWPSVGGGAPELLPTRRRTTSSASAPRLRGARASHELLDFDREP